MLRFLGQFTLGHVPPVEFEQEHNRQINPAQQPLSGELALH